MQPPEHTYPAAPAKNRAARRRAERSARQGPTQADRDRANELVQPVVAAFEKYAAVAAWHWFWSQVASVALWESLHFHVLNYGPGGAETPEALVARITSESL